MNTPTVQLTVNSSQMTAAKPLMAEVTYTGPFQNRRIGSFELIFRQNGEAVKPKDSDGYVSLKRRGQARPDVGYFIVESMAPIPARRALHLQIEQFFSKVKDTKVAQIHLEAHLGAPMACRPIK